MASREAASGANQGYFIHAMNNPTLTPSAPGGGVKALAASTPQRTTPAPGSLRAETYAGADSGASSGLSPARPPTNSDATTNPISATAAT